MSDTPQSPVTVIRNAAYIVAWDDLAQSHRLIENQDLAFAGDRILQGDGRRVHRVDEGFLASAAGAGGGNHLAVDIQH